MLQKIADFVVTHKHLFVVAYIVLAGMFVPQILFGANDNLDDMWTNVLNLLAGPLGKTIAVVGILVGAIMIFLGNMTVGIASIAGGFIIAFAPAIINAIFA